MKILVKYLGILLLISFFSNCLDKKAATNPKDGNNSSSYQLIESKIDLSNIKIGYCTPSLNAPYYKALLSSVEKTTELYGMTFYSADGQDDIVKQITAVENLISLGIDILLLNPLDANALVGVTKVAKAAGIPTFILDSGIDPSADYVTVVQSNNLKNGALVGEWLVNKMGTSKMNIALLSGSAGNPVGLTRKQGLLQGITETQLRNLGYIDLTVKTQAYTNWTYDGGLQAMEDILVTHPDINVILAEADVCVLGAIKAIRQAGKMDDILIVAAADGQKEAIQHMMDSDFYGATAMNSPSLIGRMAVEFGIQYLNGKRDFSKVSYTPELLITKENAAELYNPDAIF